MKELCAQYVRDAENGLVLGKGRRPKKASTLIIDKSRIQRHIVPLLGTRRVKDIAQSDINRFIRDVISGKTKTDVKTKPRGRAIVRGGAGTAARAVGLFGGILTYAIEHGILRRTPCAGCASLPTASGPGASAKTTIVCLGKFSIRLLAMIGSNRLCRSSDYWRYRLPAK